MDETLYVILKVLFDFALEVWFSIPSYFACFSVMCRFLREKIHFLIKKIFRYTIRVSNSLGLKSRARSGSKLFTKPLVGTELHFLSY